MLLEQTGPPRALLANLPPIRSTTSEVDMFEKVRRVEIGEDKGASSLLFALVDCCVSLPSDGTVLGVAESTFAGFALMMWVAGVRWSV